jgi:hypothetical protein
MSVTVEFECRNKNHKLVVRDAGLIQNSFDKDGNAFDWCFDAPNAVCIGGDGFYDETCQDWRVVIKKNGQEVAADELEA